LPPIIEDKQASAASSAGKASVPTPPSVVEFGADEDEAEEFEQVQLSQAEKVKPAKTPSSDPKSEDWSHQDLSKFKIDLPKEAFAIDEADLTHTSIALSSGVEEINLEDLEEIETSQKTAPRAAPKASPAAPAPSAPKKPSAAGQLGANLAALDPMHVEEILRQEVRTVLEQIAWKIIPDVAERVVREELQKLLKDAERL
jgi:hypothetical protein